MPALETESNWMIPGETAVLLGPEQNDELTDTNARAKD
jgi:hypothetical protein